MFQSITSIEDYQSTLKHTHQFDLSSTFIYSLAQAGTINVNTIHHSLTGGRPFCFVFTGPYVQMSSTGEKENLWLDDKTLFTRIFATESWESCTRWIKR
ncbi:unnamed protein product [Schistosoma turkestanicum]|nr:unnamed protein product [Schistosoma turkestanicum]